MKKSKNIRILTLYLQLMEGKIIHKSEEALRFGVDERSIQRDIDDIRAFLQERQTNGTNLVQITYDRELKGHRMTGLSESILENSEILAITKILLESRAFTKEEMQSILEKLVSGCVHSDNQKMVTDLLRNEMFHYVELGHKSGIRRQLWKLGECIQNHKRIQLSYKRMNSTGFTEDIERVVEPMAILFSEYYFYLNAYIVHPTKNGEDFEHAYDFPAIFRIDRIDSFKELPEHFHVDYANRFQEGEFRKQIQFMFAGELLNVRFRFFGNPEPVLDRIPTAKVMEKKTDSVVIQARVFGKGIMMWLLSQGDKVEVLSPEHFREEMREKIQGMLLRYQ